MWSNVALASERDDDSFRRHALLAIRRMFLVLSMLRIKDAASRLGISPSKMYQLVTRRRVAHYRIDGKILFDESDLDGYKQRCRVGAADDGAAAPHSCKAAHIGAVAPTATAPRARIKLRHLQLG